MQQPGRRPYAMTALFAVAMLLPGAAAAQTSVCKNGLDDDVDGWLDMADSGCKDAYDQSETNDMRLSLQATGAASAIVGVPYELSYTVKNNERVRSLREPTVSVLLPDGFAFSSGEGCALDAETGAVECGPLAELAPGASVRKTVWLVTNALPCTGSVTFAMAARDLGDVDAKTAEKTVTMTCRSSSSSAASNAAQSAASSAGPASSAGASSARSASESSAGDGSGASSDAPEDGPAPSGVFSDVDASSPVGQAALELAALGIVRGYDDGTFGPDRLVNRAEAAKFLVIARFRDALADRGAAFTDTDPGAWYMPYVGTAAAHGIIRGHPDGSFKPADPVNAAEFLKMLSLAFGLPEGSAHAYADVAADAWYARYAGTAEAYGLLPGRAPFLEPGRAMTRGEVAYAIATILAVKNP